MGRTRISRWVSSRLFIWYCFNYFLGLWKALCSFLLCQYFCAVLLLFSYESSVGNDNTLCWTKLCIILLIISIYNFVFVYYVRHFSYLIPIISDFFTFQFFFEKSSWNSLNIFLNLYDMYFRPALELNVILCSKDQISCLFI